MFATTKAVLAALIRNIVIELVLREIRVNTIFHSSIDTLMFEKNLCVKRSSRTCYKHAISMLPMRRYSLKEELIQVVLI